MIEYLVKNTGELPRRWTLVLNLRLDQEKRSISNVLIQLATRLATGRNQIRTQIPMLTYSSRKMEF